MNKFALQEDFEELQGRNFPPGQLWEAVKLIHERNLATIPAEVTTEDIWNYAVRNSWIHHHGWGVWYVHMAPGHGGAALGHAP